MAARTEVKMIVAQYYYDGKWYFDILGPPPEGSPSDLPELIHSDGRPYKREETAVRNGEKWLEANVE